MSAPLKMNPEIRARWVADLRAGKFPQARDVLRDNQGGRCCLGVLCEIAIEDGVIPVATRSPVTGEWFYEGEPSELPVRVWEWAGLPDANPVAPAVPGLGLAELNDGYSPTDGDDYQPAREPWSFAQIADAIEGTGTESAA